MKDLVNGVRLELNDTDLTEQQKLDVMSAVLDTLKELVDLKYPYDYKVGYMRDVNEAYNRAYAEGYSSGYTVGVNKALMWL